MKYIQHWAKQDGTLPATGSDILVRIKKNGKILEDISIADGTLFSTKVSTGSMVDGDYLTADVVRVGSTTPGTALSVRIVGDYT